MTCVYFREQSAVRFHTQASDLKLKMVHVDLFIFLDCSPYTRIQRELIYCMREREYVKEPLFETGEYII